MAMIEKDYKLIAKEIGYIFSKGLSIDKEDMMVIIKGRLIAESSLNANLKRLRSYVDINWNRKEKIYCGKGQNSENIIRC